MKALNTKLFCNEGAECILCEAQSKIRKATAHVVGDSSV